MKRFLTAGIALMLACCVALGCGGGKKKPEGLPKLFPISVKVVQGGQPLENANVTFLSDDASLMRWPTGGATDSTGVAVMSTYGFPGAPQGTFKVTITKDETVGGAQTQEEAMKAMTGEIELEAEQHFSTVDPTFSSESTTPFTIDVATDNKEIKEFDVGEAVHIERKLGM